MKTNEELINHFYSCFQNKDVKGMQECYAEKTHFNDPVFKNLNALQVKSMWDMLLSNAKDLQINFHSINTKGHITKAYWIATYKFSGTGRQVVNKIEAYFEIIDGKIIKHTDLFSFYSWAKQAFGLLGTLIGWTSFFQNSVSNKAMSKLSDFIKRKQNQNI